MSPGRQSRAPSLPRWEPLVHGTALSLDPGRAEMGRQRRRAVPCPRASSSQMAERSTRLSARVAPHRCHCPSCSTRLPAPGSQFPTDLPGVERWQKGGQDGSCFSFASSPSPRYAAALRSCPCRTYRVACPRDPGAQERGAPAAPGRGGQLVHSWFSERREPGKTRPDGGTGSGTSPSPTLTVRPHSTSA